MSLYTILGIKEDATQEEIKEAYKNMAKKNHPDKGGDGKKMAEVNGAYLILSDKDKKDRYDKTGEEAETPFHVKFSSFVSTVLPQIIDQTPNYDYTDIIAILKNHVNSVMVNLEHQKEGAKAQVKKYKSVRKRTKAKKDQTILMFLDKKIDDTDLLIKNIQSDIAFMVECEQTLDDYNYEFDAATIATTTYFRASF